jgi:predicted nucleotidyltransferase
MITPKEDIIIEKLIALAQSDGRIDVLWLYGSQAKGTANEHSDYDLVVAFNSFPEDAWDKRLQPEMLAFDWIDALGWPENRLSVADINHIPIPLALSIVTTGKVLYVKNGYRLAREENRITSMWEIDYLYHKQHYGRSI